MRSRTARAAADDGIERRPDAYAKVQGIFDTFDAMSDASHASAQSGGPWATPEAQLELAIFTRAINALKSASQLLANGHWEFAAPIVRHLYELALNLEYLQGHDDRDEAVLRYTKFGVLQKMLDAQGESEYNAETGRPASPERDERVKKILLTQFSEFRLGKDYEDGRPRWIASWSGFNTRDLAERSAHPMRKAQYLRIYRGEWSEQTHGSPVVFVDDMFRKSGPDWADVVLASDEKNIIQTAIMLQTLYLELWMMLVHIPGPDPVDSLIWSNAIRDIARAKNPEWWDAMVQPRQTPTSSRRDMGCPPSGGVAPGRSARP